MLIRVLIIMAMLIGAIGDLSIAAKADGCAECPMTMTATDEGHHDCNDNAGKDTNCGMQCAIACHIALPFAVLSDQTLIETMALFNIFPKEATSWHSRIADFEAPPPRL